MDYNLAELSIVEVRKGAKKSQVSQYFWPVNDEQKPASVSLEGGGLRRAAAISTILLLS